MPVSVAEILAWSRLTDPVLYAAIRDEFHGIAEQPREGDLRRPQHQLELQRDFAEPKQMIDGAVSSVCVC